MSLHHRSAKVLEVYQNDYSRIFKIEETNSTNEISGGVLFSLHSMIFHLLCAIFCFCHTIFSINLYVCQCFELETVCFCFLQTLFFFAFCFKCISILTRKKTEYIFKETTCDLIERLCHTKQLKYLLEYQKRRGI
jgi:hypothetical protein